MNHLVKPPDRLYPRHRSNSRQAPLRPTAEAQAGVAGVAAGENAGAEAEARAQSPTAGSGSRDPGVVDAFASLREGSYGSLIPYP